ncbi:MAG: sigma-70 family RNA polymerase sigma factor [Chloroflexi bacterium]|nr:MAG: sigma-70 family RNA polymerase sigma factor [Chloroflexota bacterium]TME51237.1 MAG: sigma-70 family RNA polymerase sigma factor [Chloroflexota bacterium]
MGATLTIKRSESSAPVTADEMCRMYAAPVARFAAMICPTTGEAEDLAQEALLRSVRSLHSYNPSRGSMEAWLWRIVANTAKDLAGRRQRMRDLVLVLGRQPRESVSVEDVVLKRVRDAELHVELRKLPWRDQTLLALRFGADLDMHRVGSAVGLSSDSASRAVRRALNRLRARLEDSHQ